ncbi:Sterol desaturase/sphingolipid hydroxylase, fatty acid hydroxylase superfamily [Chryseobacterium indologenes]|uniref:sterol desaturase family protein n=1 Tax=Chryseobacterium indologenes TaxID=253 RepID=UPI0004B7ECB6|nr:sterol desaturase family protein [Chryseobacterium indologenes]SFK06825.1 Sterol desaturase/sphingolipid hydroxylase, fatty acid hydroxylase superfamily [Chryseobacterium indologenes]SUX49357.1 Fatty acid hydroxylase superfamily [Chryseobacterium indologenes]
MIFDETNLSGFINLFWQFSWPQWIVFSFVINIFLYLFSIGLYLFIDKTCRKKALQESDHPVTSSDAWLSLLTVACNSLVLLTGAFLWKTGWIELGQNKSAGIIFLEVTALLLCMDLFMYFFHYAAHLPLIYRMLHGKHHTHVSTNFLSLFVLHPFETIGFGLMMLVILAGYDFSVISISIYLIINLIWGTIGHLNREFFPASFDRLFVGTTRFHNQHHLDETKNFGFYTSIWDRLFGTYK